MNTRFVRLFNTSAWLCYLYFACMPQLISAQIAPAHHLNDFRFGLESDFPKVKSDSFFFESVGFYAPWLHVPVYKGFGAYAEVPFAYVKPSEPIRFFLEENEQVVAFNPLIAATYSLTHSRWHFGLGVRLPLSSETNFRLVSGFLLRSSEFGLVDDVTTIQSWVIKRAKKPLFQVVYFDFLVGTDYLIFPSFSNELALKFRPRMSVPTKWVGFEAQWDSWLTVTEPFRTILNVPGLARNQISLGAELRGFRVQPHVHWVRSFEPIVDEDFGFFIRLGVSIRY